jgi:hypothetical protein
MPMCRTSIALVILLFAALIHSQAGQVLPKILIKQSGSSDTSSSTGAVMGSGLSIGGAGVGAGSASKQVNSSSSGGGNSTSGGTSGVSGGASAATGSQSSSGQAQQPTAQQGSSSTSAAPTFGSSVCNDVTEINNTGCRPATIAICQNEVRTSVGRTVQLKAYYTHGSMDSLSTSASCAGPDGNPVGIDITKWADWSVIEDFKGWTWGDQKQYLSVNNSNQKGLVTALKSNGMVPLAPMTAHGQQALCTQMMTGLSVNHPYNYSHGKCYDNYTRIVATFGVVTKDYMRAVFAQILSARFEID